MRTSSQEFLKSFDPLPEAQKHAVASEIIRRTAALDLKIQWEEEQLASLYSELANEDQALAEEGMEDYERGLLAEDAG